MNKKKRNNIVQKFINLKNEIYKQVGDGVHHETHGNFTYYTSGDDFVVVDNIKKEQSIQVASCVEITFNISRGVPSERSLLNWYGQALKTAKKEMKNRTVENLKREKATLLKELRDINRNLKDTEK